MGQARCCVAGLDLEPLLRASHIKPWRGSNNAERLDAYNGPLLSPGYDAAFNAGLITFTSDGQLMLSRHLEARHVSALGIQSSAQVQTLHLNHIPYLSYYREHVFRT